MGYEWWSSTLKVIGYIGMALVFLSTVCGGFVNDKIDKAKEGKIDDLLAGKNSLLASVDDYRRQLEEKQVQIDDLRAKAVNASRNLSSYYEFNGDLIRIDGGKHSSIIGERYEIFEKFHTLQAAKDWSALKSICTEAIAETPRWLTPYFYRGVAYFQLNEPDLAKQDLEFVVSEAGDSAAYAQARELLKIVTDHIDRSRADVR
ncbi:MULTISPECIES: tol-pal system YbgF family protein [unclassified Pseudomonas]|uniref:tetratricopeptide repeat protein n=1 Tax=unclassified Pseudomonas TaxID=196821 RepID=UPI0012FD5B72|nr:MULTISPECIES: hypothetical protein [unclassified Pseudomonas]